MRQFFTFLTIGLILIGFWIPIAWAGAILTGIFAVGSAPSGRRPDGKAWSGGLLGPLFDRYQISQTMKDCPYCQSKILKEASKCPYCGEWVNQRHDFNG